MPILDTEKLDLIAQKKAVIYGTKDSERYPMHVKDVDTEKKTVSMVWNTYNFLDSQGDVLLKGCSEASIKQNQINDPAAKNPAKIKHALHHDLRLVPSVVTMLKEGGFTYKGKGYFGILAESRFTDSTLGKDTLINYNEGVIDNHSIGYKYLDLELIDRESKDWDKYIGMLVNPEAAEGRDYIFVVKQIELYEGSGVSFGANYLTPTLGMKGATQEEIQRILLDKVDAMKHFHDRIVKQVRAGKQSDSTLRKFDLQALQVKQVLRDLLAKEPLDAKKIVNKIEDQVLPLEPKYAHLCNAFKL